MHYGRVRVSPAMIVAVFALVLAIGGTGYAASRVGSSATKAPTLGPKFWGNVRISPGGADVTLEQVGPFTLKARCTASGEGEYVLTSKVKSLMYGEDSGPGVIAAKTPNVVTDDEDYDEAFYAWAPSTHTSLNATPLNWAKDSTIIGNKCEFQGVLFRTS